MQTDARVEDYLICSLMFPPLFLIWCQGLPVVCDERVLMYVAGKGQPCTMTQTSTTCLSKSTQTWWNVAYV